MQKSKTVLIYTRYSSVSQPPGPGINYIGPQEA